MSPGSRPAFSRSAMRWVTKAASSSTEARWATTGGRPSDGRAARSRLPWGLPAGRQAWARATTSADER